MGVSMTYNWKLCVLVIYLVKVMAKVYNIHMVLKTIIQYLRGWK